MASLRTVSPPAVPEGPILLPEELERRPPAAREREDIPLDIETRREIGASVKPLRIAFPAGLGA